MNKDLTVGKPSTVLWQFCIPLFGSIIFQQLYNIADSFVAGKFVGEDALAAVGNSYEITLIFIAFAMAATSAARLWSPRCSAPAPRSPRSSCSKMHCPFSLTATEQTFALVSICSMHAIIFYHIHF